MLCLLSRFGKGLKNAALNKFAAANNKAFGDKAYIKWNFTKFLVDREGRVIASGLERKSHPKRPASLRQRL